MNQPFRVGFCVSGHGRLCRAAVLHASQLGIVPALVVTDGKEAADLSAFCERRGIPFISLRQAARADFDRALLTVCTEARLDLLALTFNKLIPASLVQHYRSRIINVHMALLPAFKGMRGMEQALAAGARFVGATIHEVDEQMDHGAIIAQCQVGARRHDDAATASDRVFGLLRLMYLQVIQWYRQGRVEKDERGRIWIKDAVYGELPVSPAIECGFADSYDLPVEMFAGREAGPQGTAAAA